MAKKSENTKNEIKEIGKVTEAECAKIRGLFERRNALRELFITLGSMSAKELENNALYEKIVNDLGAVSTAFDKWWNETPVKYKWENKKGCRWVIDFDTGVIKLVKG